jgi:hypothetical protein
LWLDDLAANHRAKELYNLAIWQGKRRMQVSTRTVNEDSSEIWLTWGMEGASELAADTAGGNLMVLAGVMVMDTDAERTSERDMETGTATLD